jgi:signal transduction histidine kinase/ligand-binding sensor domain-containing protein
MRSHHTFSRRQMPAALFLFTLAFVALPACALDVSKPLTAYSRQSWQTGNGLPQNSVHAILQTRDGYIWLATEGGLVRFDGLKFRVYDAQNTPGLRSNTVRSLLEDRARALWIGTADGLARYDGSKFQAFTTEDGLPNNSVLSIYEDRSGKLSAVTSDGLAVYGNKRFHTSRSTEGPETLLRDRSGRLWTRTPGGLAVADSGRSATYSMKEGLPSNRVTFVYEDREAAVWIGTDGGLARLTNGKIERFPSNDVLSGDIVLSAYEDREGNLWLGTESDGLYVLRDQKFVMYTSKDGLAGDLARSIFQDRDGTVWIGTNEGLSRFADGRFSSLTAKDGLSSNTILGLAEDAEGNLLAGTPDGLNVIRGGHVTVITTADGLADDFVRSVYRDGDGSVWIGTRRGLSHWIHRRFKTYTQADGLGSDFVGTLLGGRDGSLWIATLGGLTRFTGGKFKNYTTADGLSSNVVTALQEDADGAIWIGTQGGGLNRFANGKILDYPAMGLPETIYGILKDAEGSLWISSKTGIFRAKKQAGGALLTTQYGTADGLRVSECSEGGHPAVWRNRDGSLWFSTVKGVAAIDLRTAERKALPLPVVLESLSVDDRTFDPGDTAPTDVAPGHSRFSFEYAGLTFYSPQRARFRYRLEGFDHAWIDAGTRRVAYYTNLRPGQYRFRVSARAYDGDWSGDEASWAFRLRPHFYQTYWFYLLLAILLAAAVYEIYRWRVRQVEAQFKAVLAERNRIAREIHDTLAQGFVAVSVQLELISRRLSGSPNPVKELIDQTRELVRDGLAEARRSIWDLRAQASESHDSEGNDFATKLSKVATQVTARTPLKVRFEVIGTYRALPGNIENELLRIGQEAITNVVRHAGAQHIDIRLDFDARHVKMTIADDGRGLGSDATASSINGHYGLQGMRERAEQIGAELTVASTPGGGTQVRVEAPIH